MSAENPDNNMPSASDNTSDTSSEYNRSDALKKAIMKLKGTERVQSVDDEADTQETALPSLGSEQATERIPSETEDATDHADADLDPHEISSEALLDSWGSPVDDADASPPTADTQAPIATRADTDDDWVLPTESTAESEDTPPREADTPEDAPTLAVPSEIVVTSQSADISERTDQTSALTTQERIPWTLQQFFDGEIDLDIELSKRFPNVPLLSTIKYRTMGSKSGRRVATLGSADGMSSLIVDADIASKVIQLSFSYGSMMTLRFALVNLSDMDRTRWLELMRRDEGGLAFLWGPTRWQEDYLICIVRKHATNIYAFSPNNFESAIRLTPATAQQLLDWLDEVWNSVASDDDDEDAPLLTW